MSDPSERIESLFATAINLSLDAREGFLDRECGDDESLRGLLQGLLKAHDREDHALDRPAIGNRELEATCLSDQSEVGTVIANRFKLLEQIGEGGMGTVWVAQQTEPVNRKVALKLIKAGMDSKAVIARFEAERQALAMMDHPNIAKVLDGGLTEAGRPYFVMEYVKGVPITDYCDQVRLSIPDRLNLFVQVCAAVQHAHQKGIIHRDLKPSNILVAPYDDRPVPKVIDFGLAKALNQRLTERTLHTAHETVIGTPLYMSPEQAQLNNLDVDTRSDIYSLGVLLYELLTGTTPLEKARFKEAAWDEIRRIIRDEEPPRPSTRLSSSGTLPSLAACRQTEPVTLTRQLKGELDWIIMKALEKERTRRYETATGLAKDVQRYLAGETVDACPPTLGYRMQKLFRKHRAAVMTTGSISLILLLGIVVSTWMAVRASHAERIAHTEKIKAETASQDTTTALEILGNVLQKLNPYHRPKDDPPTVEQALVQACGELDLMPNLTPSVRAAVRSVFGQMLLTLHVFSQGQLQLKLAWEELNADPSHGPDHLTTIAAQEKYGRSLLTGERGQANLKLAQEVLEAVYELRKKNQGAGHVDTLKTLYHALDSVAFFQGNFAECRRLNEEALKIARSEGELGPEHPVTAEIESGLAMILLRTSDEQILAQAEELAIHALKVFKDKCLPNDVRIYKAKRVCYSLLGETGNNRQEISLLQNLIGEVESQVQTPEFEELRCRCYDSFVLTCLLGHEYDLADQPIQMLLNLAEGCYGPLSPLMNRYKVFRAWQLVGVQKYVEAEDILDELIANDANPNSEIEGTWDGTTRLLMLELKAKCLIPQAKFAEAMERLQEAEELWPTIPKHLSNRPSLSRTIMRVNFLNSLIEVHEALQGPDTSEEDLIKLANYRAELAKWQEKIENIHQ